MSSFKELMRVAEISIKDKTSGKRMREINKVLWKHKAYEGLTPEKATAILEDLGPTFIKMGQIASSRSDMLPKAYCDAFETLHTHVEPESFAGIVALIEKAYQKPWQEVFSSIDEKPLGSASIAQVHKAVLLDGSEVAVKVERDGVAEKMAEDIMLMKHILALAEFSTNSAGNMMVTLDGFVSELERTTAEELDFTVELENLVQFSRNLDGQKGITSPTPYPEYSTDTILVMELVSGISIGERDTLVSQGYDLEKIGTLLAQSYVTQVIDNGFFHADPHQGNILIKNDTLVWIDLGMVGRLTSKERALVAKMFEAMASGDTYELKDTLLALTEGHGPVDHGLLLEQIDSMLSAYASADLSEINVGTMFYQIIEILRSQNLTLPTSFTMLARGFLTLEGVLVELTPSVSVLDILSEHVKKMLLNLDNIEHRIKDFVRTGAHSAELSAGIPAQISHSLDMLNRGELSVNMKTRVSHDILASLYAVSGRLSMAMISAGLFIGSSILCTTNMEPRILEVPILGFLGYIGAFVLGTYVIWRSLVSRYKQRNNKKMD